MTLRQTTIYRVCAEIIIAGFIGYFICLESSWWDLDAPKGIAFYWYPVLLAVGLLFGLLGRSPVLLVGPVTAWSGILAEMLDVLRYGFSWAALGIYAFLFALMALTVIVGAAIGRATKRRWIRRRMALAGSASDL